MRLSILLIIAMALWVVTAFAQTSTAPPATGAQKGGGTDKPRKITEAANKKFSEDWTVSKIQEIDLEGLKKLLQPDAKDARPLLVNFWATWCDPCREEFPDLVKIDEDYRAKKNLNFVTVSLDDVAELKTEVPKFLKEMKATMLTVLLNVPDPEPAIKAVDTSWTGQLPATFLYDKEGKVVFRHFGKIKPEELRAAIEKEVSRKQ